jgi:DNA/RNA-binding domain of Phe-tRNA-synthetase-like protein
MIRIERKARELGVFVAVAVSVNIEVRNSPEELISEMRSLKERAKGEELTTNPIVRAYRDFYWRIGLDPTKVRPSGEALRRRLTRGKDLPSINNVVDSGNLVSAETLVPIGLYDLDKVKGELRITLSEGRENFDPLGAKGEVTLNQGIPIMRDDEKVIHLYPHRDSVHTSISSSTHKVLIVAAGVSGVPREIVSAACKLVLTYLSKYCSGSGSETEVI